LIRTEFSVGTEREPGDPTAFGGRDRCRASGIETRRSFPFPRPGFPRSKPDFCPTCDGRRIIKRGLRKNCFRRLQIYSCKDCEAYFVSLVGLKGAKYPPRVIARTLCLYNLGHTQEEAARRIATEHRITVPRRTISHWISAYRPITTFHRLRNVSVRAFGGRMLKERTLEHQQTYEYKVHLSKLALTAYFLHL
jgi:transposase-like protein